jgi:hypothetical protein
MKAVSPAVAGGDAGVIARTLVIPVLLAAVTVALLDAVYVVVVFAWMLDTTTAQRIFQSIATALIDRPTALAGGWGTATVGALLHLVVSLAWAATWAVAYAVSLPLRRAVRTTRGGLVVGAAYGMVVHLAMQLAVLPLTRAVTGPLFGRVNLLVLLAHVLIIGPPIVLAVRDRRTRRDVYRVSMGES